MSNNEQENEGNCESDDDPYLKAIIEADFLESTGRLKYTYLYSTDNGDENNG